MELERVLTKLKFDESVTGYALITNDGQPFLSFSLPDEVVPQIKGTLRIHAANLKLVNIMTSQGSVILSRVDPQWVLAVLFTPELTLGTALSRAKSVVELLEQVALPPPPVPVDLEEDLVPETEQSAVHEQPIELPVEPDVTPVAVEASTSMKAVELTHGCVVLRGEKYKEAVTLDSGLNLALKKIHANLGVDVLLVIDEKMTIYQISASLVKPAERVAAVIKWCLREKIVDVDCPAAEETSQKEIVELPLFEGNIEKAKKEHRQILELCDGTRTLQEISTELGILYFEALQSILPYRGKTLRMVRTDKKSGE
ncbi:MAG: hypothetical protein ACFFDV_01265 [Candidatus Thorarchaeota archaeon]